MRRVHNEGMGTGRGAYTEVVLRAWGRVLDRAAVPLLQLIGLGGLSATLAVLSFGFLGEFFFPVWMHEHAIHATVHVYTPGETSRSTWVLLFCTLFFSVAVCWLSAALALLVADVWWRGEPRPLGTYLSRAGAHVWDLLVLALRHLPWFLAGAVFFPCAVFGAVRVTFIGLMMVLQGAEGRAAREGGKEVFWRNPELTVAWGFGVMLLIYACARVVENFYLGAFVISAAVGIMGVGAVTLFLEHAKTVATEAKTSAPIDFRDRATRHVG